MSGARTVAHIRPEVLRWARESAGYSLRQAADKINIDKWYLETVEGGSELLSLREAERAADAYERPLAALFLPEPPDEEPQEVQFRRLPGTPSPPWGHEIQLTARKVTERQTAAREIYEALEESPPWPRVAESFTSAPRESLAARARQVLSVAREEQRSWTQDKYASLRGWRTAVEALGVLVMQQGPVSIDEMRGFASLEPSAVPAILVNSKDDPRARAFTLIHEFGHLILASRGEQTVGNRAERWCEEFAGRVLMPEAWLAEELAASEAATALGRIHDVARAFHVTPLAAAVRVARAELVSRDDAQAAISAIRARWSEEDENRQTGGDYYKNQVARFGPSYLGLIFTAVDTQAVTLPAASALLDGVKVKRFDSLRDQLEGRR